MSKNEYWSNPDGTFLMRYVISTTYFPNVGNITLGDYKCITELPKDKVVTGKLKDSIHLPLSKEAKVCACGKMTGGEFATKLYAQLDSGNDKMFELEKDVQT